jgi:hypothetical protein
MSGSHWIVETLVKVEIDTNDFKTTNGTRRKRVTNCQSFKSMVILKDSFLWID